MNVACTACPAKYAVPDDRVRGKRVRITCKHCGTFIVVDGTHLGEGGSQAGRMPQNTAANAAREKRKTMLGIGGSPNASAAASLGVPAQSSPRASRVPPADVPSHHAWLVALSDGRREPASLARIVDLFVANSIDTSTYIWREGMPDWKKPFEIPEIAAALRARGVAPDGTKGATLPPPDPEEATRVSFSPSEELGGQPQAAAKPATATRPPASTKSFDDESVTVALSGPPSNPMGQGRPLTPPNSGLPGRRATLPPLPQAAGLPRSSSEPAMPRVRPNTIPPIGSPLPRPPVRSFTPNPAPPPVMAAPTPPPPPPVIASSLPPAVMAAPQLGASSFPPPAVAPYGNVSSAPPPYGHVSSMPPAVVPSVRPVGYAAPAQFPVIDGVPRSGPPVSLQLDDNPFQKRGRAATVAASLILVAGLGIAGYVYFGQRAAPPPPPPPIAATPPAPPPAPAPAPTPSETAEPEPAPSAVASAPAPTEKVASAPKASPAPRAHRDEAPPRPSTRRSASSDSSDSEGASPSSASTSTSDTPSGSDSAAAEPSSAEAAMAARLARSDDAPAAPKSNSNDPEFNRDAAAQSLGDAASRADSCRTLGGPSGTGQATVTFSPNGRVSAASVGGEFAGTTVGACITRLFRGVTVPAFSGDAVTVSKRFTIE